MSKPERGPTRQTNPARTSAKEMVKFSERYKDKLANREENTDLNT